MLSDETILHVLMLCSHIAHLWSFVERVIVTSRTDLVIIQDHHEDCSTFFLWLRKTDNFSLSSSYGKRDYVVDTIEKVVDGYLPLWPRPHDFFRIYLKKEVRLGREVLSLNKFAER